MKTVLMTLVVLMTSSFAMAHDSKWAVCSGPAALFGENNALVLNYFERRNDSGDGRATDLTLIFGNNILTGTHESAINSTAAVSLKSANGSSVFEGNFSDILQANKVRLNGKLKLVGTQTWESDVEVMLSCKTLRE